MLLAKVVIYIKRSKVESSTVLILKGYLTEGTLEKIIVAIICHEMILGNFVNVITAQRIILSVLRDGSSSRERRAWKRGE